MRCDRPAMSCGRPDGPAAMSPVRVCARGSSYRPIPPPFFRLESPFQVGDFFFFFFRPGKFEDVSPLIGGARLVCIFFHFQAAAREMFRTILNNMNNTTIVH